MKYFENLSLLKSIAKGKKHGSFTLQYELKKFLKIHYLQTHQNMLIHY